MTLPEPIQDRRKGERRETNVSTYDVKWRRPNYPDEILECHGLSAELLTFRIRGVIRMCGSVELLAVIPVIPVTTETKDE